MFDFYDIINEFYPTYSNVIDDTYLDKAQLTSFVIHMEKDECVPETKIVAVEKDTETASAPMVKNENILLKKVKAADAPRFKITSIADKEKEIDYFRVTPENVLKKRRKTTKQTTEIKPVAEIKGTEVQPLKSAEDPADMSAPIIADDVKAEQNGGVAANPENASAAAEILGIIVKSDGITLDGIMAVSDLSFGELSEILADLEISGAVACGAGGIYTVKKA